MRIPLSLAFSLAACLTVAASAVPASALTAPQKPAVTSDVVKADWYCGPGWHLNRYGRCVRNHRYYGPGFYGWYGYGYHHHHHHRYYGNRYHGRYHGHYHGHHHHGGHHGHHGHGHHGHGHHGHGHHGHGHHH